VSEVKAIKVKRMNLNVPEDLHNAFKAATAVKGDNMTTVLMEFIQGYVAKHSSPSKKGRR
jgi:hypothetical protein